MSVDADYNAVPDCESGNVIGHGVLEQERFFVKSGIKLSMKSIRIDKFDGAAMPMLVDYALYLHTSVSKRWIFGCT